MRRMRLAAMAMVCLLAGCEGAHVSEPGPFGWGDEPGASTRPAPQAYSHPAALALYRAGKYAELEALCKRGIRQVEREHGPKSPQLAPPLDDLAMGYLRTGRYADAREPLERAESVLDKSTPDGAIQYAKLCINKGWRLFSLGEVDAADKVFEEGRDLLQKYQKAPSVDLAELINNIGLAYEENDDGDPAKVKEAKGLLLKGWEMRKKLTGDESYETAESLNNLGMYLLYHAEGEQEIAAAIAALKKSLAISEKVYGQDNPETAMAHVNLAVAYHITQQDDLAEKELDIAIPITARFFPTPSSDRSYEMQVLGQIQESQGKYAAAEESFKEGINITRALFGAGHPFVASGMEYLANLYQEMGNEAKQREVQKEIEKVRGRNI